MDRYRSVQNKPANSDIRLLQGEHCQADRILHEFYEGEPIGDWQAYESAMKRDRKYQRFASNEGMTFKMED